MSGGQILVKRKVVAARIGPYAVAAGWVLLAAAAQFAVANWVGGLASFTVFFPAIVAGALLGAGPGALGLGLSLALGWSYWTWTAGSAPPGSRDALDLFLIALSGAIIVLIIETYRRRQSPFSHIDPLFKAVQDISLEGVVVYRAVLDRGGQVRDFEYRYANPAACAIMMNPSSDEIVGAKLLERLPLAREHAAVIPAIRPGVYHRRDFGDRIRAGRPLVSQHRGKTWRRHRRHGPGRVGEAARRGRTKTSPARTESPSEKPARVDYRDGQFHRARR